MAGVGTAPVGKFTTRDGRILRVAAFGLDTGGIVARRFMHTAGVGAGSGFSLAKALRETGDWPTHASRSKSDDALWPVGVEVPRMLFMRGYASLSRVRATSIFRPRMGSVPTILSN